eukprot:Plantae.Rhodophyta-Purpureofilum_apyrenoidigerum.ctg4969.p1 GENE.Plantae.Rhodophyta-Purpureofilum_apyrenoidigerum.ctg4969~~Plantae.Rhodophyta-Purpureofilum_apyrenoidigerum.ctg4969.p1  ORF type:complete len:434 (+),score=75.39 Plantae.Rhodophyta-Purpureofilum_apyrenoidigerum.ctg4969:169-1470(+)
MKNLFVLVLGIAALGGLCEGQLFHVTVVVRHGAREHLDKEQDPRNGEGGASLLYPEGSNMARRLGELLRERYVEGKSGEKIDTGGSNKLTPALIKIKSSNLDRTLATAAGIARGLSPTEALPVEAAAEEENDYLIRAYTKCPVFSERLQTFHNSEEFAAKESETQKFREQYAKGYPGESSDLFDWFNIYDQYLLAKDYGNNSNVQQPQDGIDIDGISSDDFLKMQEIMDWVELRRYSSEVAGVEVGSRLWSEIRTTIRNVTDDERGVRLNIYSAHYPTILSLLSTIGAEQPSQIPDFCDTLILEYHDDGLMLYHAKFEENALEYVALKFNSDFCKDPKQACPLEILDDRLGDISSMTTNTAACNTCGNTECPATNISTPASRRVVSGTIGFVIGIASCALVWLAIILYRRHKRSSSYDLEATKAGYVPDIDNS